MAENIGKPASAEFKRILNKIKNRGLESSPRGNKVREILMQTLEIHPLHPIIDFDARPMNWKYLAGEIGWYLRKEKTLEHIKPFSSFWNTLVNEHNEVNSNYGELLFGEQLRWVYDSLVADRDSRQAIAFLNQPKFQTKGNKDFVCTMYLNFFIRKNKLNLKMTIRSNDMFYGFSYDAPFFSFVQQHMYLWLKETKYPDLELGTYYHYADNIHYYEKHFSIASKILKQDMKTPPYFELTQRMFDIDCDGNFTMTDTANNFCDDVYNLALKEQAKSSIPNYQSYINAMKQFFKIDATY